MSENFAQSLVLMGQGMSGIFIVMIAIALIVVILTKGTNR